MSKFHIINKEQIKRKIEKMKNLGWTNDGWTEHFIDDENQNWELTNYESEYHGGGISVLRKKFNLSVDYLIDLIFESNDLEEISAIALELYDKEQHQKIDFREKLLNQILKQNLENLNSFEKEKIKLIIFESSLYDATNRKEILGKTHNQIMEDAKYYREISEKSKEILKKL